MYKSQGEANSAAIGLLGERISSNNHNREKKLEGGEVPLEPLDPLE